MTATWTSTETADESFSGSSEPKFYRSLAEIYVETEIVDIIDELMILKAEGPSSFKEATEEKEWSSVMMEEFEIIEKNGTWTFTDLPPGHKPIGLKLVYKLKKSTKGNVVKYNTRLVAKGYVQRNGIAYSEVFISVARLDTVRMLLALSAKDVWEVHLLDVKSAFLNGELYEEVYVTQREGFVKEG